jgi:hypothetical protein
LLPWYFIHSLCSIKSRYWGGKICYSTILNRVRS